jgi:hypothetical protein
MSKSVIRQCPKCGTELRPDQRRSTYCSRRCGVALDLRGKTFGRLTFIERVGFTEKQSAIWAARCECGKTVTGVGHMIVSGKLGDICGCQTQTTAQRFWEKVDRRGPDECWEWLASTIKKRGGYGQFGIQRDGRNINVYAHRFAYELTHGTIPVGLLRHSCDNPPCCNPAHLIPGSHADNTDDMMARGRHRVAPLLGERHGCAKLTDVRVLEIRRRVASGEASIVLAHEYGVHRSTIKRAASGKRWSHVR